MPPRPAALVLLNPAAGGGRALGRWGRIEEALETVCRPHVIQTDLAGAWRAAVAGAVEEGVRFFIAAGGDGTVGALVDELVRARSVRDLASLTLGAVGLGSSNDFHKPFGHLVAGIPVRIEPSGERRDVGIARLVAPDGTRRTRHFVVSASVGVVAEANAFFNTGDRVQGWLRAKWTGLAILYAAGHSIATYHNIGARLRADGATLPAAVTNLSVSKTPFVSGMFRYDASVRPDDGLLAVHLCEAMSRFEALGALADLARGRFLGKPKRRHWRASRVALEFTAPVAVELDGEVSAARRVTFGVLKDRVCVCH